MTYKIFSWVIQEKRNRKRFEEYRNIKSKLEQVTEQLGGISLLVYGTDHSFY